MDDTRRQKTLDQLGDIFLTGTHDAAAQGPAVSTITPEEIAQLMDPANTPEPIRLMPKRPGATPPVTAQPRMIKGAPSGGASPLIAPPRDVDGANVEVVFLGNLPGFSGPWLTQYAHALSQDVGPVAVLHFDDEQVALDLVGAIQHREALAALCDAVQTEAMDGLAATISELTAADLPAIGAWLIHLPMPIDSVVAELASDLPVWTLITGSDDAALAAAGHWLSALTDDDTRGDAHTARLAVMGVPEPTAKVAVNRFIDAADALSDATIEPGPTRHQMQPVAERHVGSFALTEGLWESLLDFVSSQSHSPRTLEAVPAPLPVQTPAPVEQPRANPINDIDDADPLVTSSELAAPVAEPPSREEASARRLKPKVVTPQPQQPQAPVAPERAFDDSVPREPEAPANEQPDDQPDTTQPDARPVAAPMMTSSLRAFVERLARTDGLITSTDQVRRPAEAPASEDTAFGAAAPAAPPQTPRPAAPRDDVAPPAPRESVRAAAPRPAPTRRPQPRADAPPVRRTPAAPPARREAPVAAADAASTTVAPPVRQAARPVPSTPAATPAPTGPASTAAPDVTLAAYVSGAIPLAARCPHRPDTELAVDEAGRVHILAHCEVGDARDRAEAGTRLRGAMAELVETRAWVREHLALIRLTQKQITFDEQAGPVLHLFTDHARGAAAMVTRVEPDVHLHLMQSVTVGDNATWFCTELT